MCGCSTPSPGRASRRCAGSGPAEVQEKFGVGPDKVIDVQALCGDAVDNVPGVPGIGVKTAAELINAFGDVETLLSRTGRDQAAQAAAGARGERRARAHLEAARDAEPRRAARHAARRAGARADRAGPAVPVPQGDGVHQGDQPSGAKCWRSIPTTGTADPDLAPKKIEPIGFNNEAKEVARQARLAAEGRGENAAVQFARRARSTKSRRCRSRPRAT